MDYEIYEMSKKEKLTYIGFCAFGIFLVAYIFYHNIFLSLLICPFSLFYPGIRKKEIIIKRRNELNIQFKDLLYAISSSLSAGRSIETAFKEVIKDIEIIYPTEDTLIINEIHYINKCLELNQPIEEIFTELGKRSQIEDIQNFASVLKTCKKAGGDLKEVIRKTSNIIEEKIEIKEEIETMMAEKKFEQKLMSFLPIIMILILSVSASDYMEPVFSTVIGKVLMTIAMGVMVLGYFITKKIVDIKV